MKKVIKHFGLKMAFAAATVFAVQSAVADSLTFNGLFYSGADTVHISNTTPLIAEYAYSGGFRMSDTTGAWTVGSTTYAKNESFMAWCIDIYDNMASANYTLTADQPIPSISHGTLTSDRVEALERLASNDLALVHDAQTSSAFQLAAWEIMAETASSYNLGNGNFHVFGDALGADTLANTWLSNLGTATPAMELYIWKADVQGSTQDLAVFAPVPEPETYAMMLAGLGLMGFIARRRRERDIS